MADSLESKDAAKESGKSRRSPRLVVHVHHELSITSTASAEETLLGFQPMTEDMKDGVFTSKEVAIWLQTLSRIGKCQSLYWCAEKYAHRIVDDEEVTHGDIMEYHGEHWLWFRDDKTFWLRRIGMTEEEYEVLGRFGFDRGTEMYQEMIRKWDQIADEMTSLKQMWMICVSVRKKH